MVDAPVPRTSASAALLQRDQRVDHFLIVRPLGHGGFGEVYLARDTRLGRRVALKIVHPRHLGSAEAVQRFLFEARATARFSHPHIVTVYAVGEHEGMPYVALEYLEGRTLRQQLQDGPLARAEALRTALAIAEALQEAHAGGILHRDLKPENILLARDGRLRVLDFGLAKRVDAQSVAATEAPTMAAQAAAVAPTEMMSRPSGSEPFAAALSEHAAGATPGPTLPPQTQEQGAMVTPLLIEGDASQTLGAGFDSSALSGVRGTPYYMAPEQWAAAQQTTAVDLWAFGVLLHELLTGTFPFEARQPLAIGHEVCSGKPLSFSLDAKELSPELLRLVGDCLDKDPAVRPTAARTVEVLRELLSSGRAEIAEEQGPFRGLLPFGELHAGLYFGREAELAAFLELLRDEPVLAVVGPSGAGKSSFVAAGVVPRLREQGRTILLRMRPGADPFGALAARLRSGEQTSAQVTRDGSVLQALQPASAVDEAEALAAELRATPTRLGLHLRRLADEQQARIVLFVDQLEELFTLSPAAQRLRFMQALASASDDAREPVRTIVTLRDDFLGRVAEGDAARRVLARIVVLRSPDRTALEAILTRSLAAFGYRYEDERIVGEMLDAIGEESAALPLLSFAGRVLWERRQREARLLPRAAYEQMGGVAGALATHADAVVQGLSSEQQSVARSLLLRLITAEGTRRAMPRTAVLEGLGEEAPLVLGRLTEARLLTVRQGTDGAEHELAHETLISSWKRLARWLDESRDERVFLAEIEQAAQLWLRRGRRDDEVWSGDALDDARRGLARCEVVPELVAEFIAAAERRAEARELAARRRRGMVRGAIVGASLALLAVTAAWAVALRSQAYKAAVARDDAITQLARAHSEGATLAWRQGELRKARAMLRGALEAGLSRGPLPAAVAQQVRRTAWQLDHEPLLWKHAVGSQAAHMAFSPDGRRLLVAVGPVHLYDLVSGTSRQLRDAAARISAVGFSADGSKVLLGDYKGRIVWFPLDGGPGGSLPGKARGSVHGFSPTADGLWVRTSRGLQHWPGAGPWGASRATSFQKQEWTRGVTIVRGAPHFFTGFKQLQYHRGQAVELLDRGRVYGPAISIGSSLAFTRGMPARELVFVSDQGARREIALRRAIRRLAYEPHRHLLAAGSDDGTITLWDVRGPVFLRRLSARTGLPGRRHVNHLLFSADGSLLAALTMSGSLLVWRVAPLLRQQDAGHAGSIFQAALRPDGQLAATVGSDDTLRFWAAATGQQLMVWKLPQAASGALAFSPDGKHLAVGVGSGIDLLDGNTGRVLQALPGHRGAVSAFAFDPATHHLASVSRSDRTLRIWKVSQGDTGMRVIPLPGTPSALAWRSDGRAVAVALLRHAKALVVEVEVGTQRAPRVLVSRTGKRRYDGPLALRYRATGKVLYRLEDGRLYEGSRLVDGASPGIRSDLTSNNADDLYYSFPPGAHHNASLLVLRSFDDDRIVRRFPHRHVTTAAADVAGLTVTGTLGGAARLWGPQRKLPSAHTPLLVTKPLRLVGREGVRELQSGLLRPARLAWERAAARSLRAHASPIDSSLCLIDTEGRLSLWDRGSDRRIFERRLDRWLRHKRRSNTMTTYDAPFRLAAGAGGCIVVSGDGLYLHRPGPAGAAQRLVGQQHLAREPRLLVAGTTGVFGFDATGQPKLLRSEKNAAGVWDLGSLLGIRRRGRLLLRSWTSEGPEVPLEVNVRSIMLGLSGPAKTLFLGLRGGTLRVVGWDAQQRLRHFKLHGPIIHLHRSAGMLLAATELGDYRFIDLAALELSECALLRRVWRQVPVVWQEGRLIVRAAPAQHRCVLRQRGTP